MQLRTSFAGLAVIGVLASWVWPAAAADPATDYEWFDPIIVVRRFLLDGFYETPDESAIQRAMIDAMIDALDDPYTVYIPPADEAEFNKVLRGTYVGIGAEVNIEGDYLTIVSPLEGSPALDAGIMAGDVVLSIEGQSTLDRPVNECIDQLLGEPGTSVNIRVRHLDGTESDLTIRRQEIVTRSVRGVRRTGETWGYWLDEQRRIGYIRISQFVEATFDELLEAFAQLQEGGLQALVLDLRGNPGGDLGVAIQTADLFIADGTIVSVRGRSRRPQSWRAKPEGTLPDFPMIVMVNRHSASASEIVAGALQENRRAKVLGSRTFGKGSVQEVHDLPYDRGTLKMTSGHYYLGSDRNISRMAESPVWGVDPDPGFVVRMTDETFRQAILARREYEIIRPGATPQAGDFADPSWIREHMQDDQLAKAEHALQTRLDTGVWPVVGEGDATQLALEQQIAAQTRVQRRLLDRLVDVEQRLAVLNDLADEAGRAPLLPADADLTDALLTVRDRHGAVLGQYRVVGGDLEFALRQVQLDAVDDDR